MRVLMIVQELNETSWLRGFIVDWVRALAQQVEHVEVLTLELGQVHLPANVTVHSMGKEKGKNRLRELFNFYRELGRVINKVDVIFSHMTPRYVWLAAPYALLYHKPQLLWFIHPKVSAELRLALFFSRWVVTATESSFPLASPKVHPVGHGIDTARFSPSDTPEIKPPLVLAVGRMTPIKFHHILLEAAALLHHEAIQFAIVGAPAAPGDEAYQANLLQRRDELGLSEAQFQLRGAMSIDEVIALTRQAMLVTNLTPPGSFDKAALEGMLIGKALLTANPNFDSLLGDYKPLLRLNRHDDAQEVAAKIKAMLASTAEERHQMGVALRERTAAAHGLESLMQKVINLIAP